jgi:hypothetical protein
MARLTIGPFSFRFCLVVPGSATLQRGFRSRAGARRSQENRHSFQPKQDNCMTLGSQAQCSSHRCYRSRQCDESVSRSCRPKGSTLQYRLHFFSAREAGSMVDTSIWPRGKPLPTASLTCVTLSGSAGCSAEAISVENYGTGRSHTSPAIALCTASCRETSAFVKRSPLASPSRCA